MPKREITISVGTWAASLPSSFLLCRDIGHLWKPWTAAWDQSIRGYRRTLRCQRCSTDRVEILSATGHKESGHYDYPDDYLTPAGTGHLVGTDRDALRLESVARLVDDEVGAARARRRSRRKAV